MINKNFKVLLTLFTVFIGNVSYCMEDNSIINNNLEQKNNLPLFRLNDEEFTKYNNVLYNVNTLIDDVYNECIDTTNVVFDNIINTIENNFFITVDICDYLSSQTIVPLQKVQQVLKLFNTFEPSINKNSTAILFKELQLQFDKQSSELQISTNSNTITNINTSKNNIKEHTEITPSEKDKPLLNAETTHISLGKFLRIIQGCIRRLQTQILTALDQSRFSGNDIKAVHEQNKKILQTAFNIMKNAYDEYSTIFLDYANGKFLKQKSANLRETILAIPEEINKLDSIYYYGSTFQKRFDKLHSSLLDMLKIIISAIDNKKIKNIAILCFPYALFGNTMSYEKLHIFNEETGNYDSYKNICTNPDENIVSLKEYLQDLSKFLIDRKKLTDENIQKVIKKRYILKYDDIKYKIFPQYLKTTYSVMQYWLIQYTHGGEKEIENKLPIVYTYIINEFAKYYKLTKQYWPPLLPESLDYIRKQNIHFEEFLD